MPRGKKKTSDVAKQVEDQLNSKSTSSQIAQTPQATEFVESSDGKQNTEQSITMEQLKEIIKEEAQKLYQNMTSESKRTIQKLQDDFSEFKHNQQRLIENLRHEVATKDARVKQLELQIDTMEQQQLSKTVRIVNLPEIEEDKDIKQNIVGIATDNLKMKNIRKADIVKAHRMGKQNDNKPRDLILTFADEDKRNAFRNESQKAKLKTEDGTPVYVNDNLTIARLKLFYDCRKWRKTKVLHSTWTQRGILWRS